MQLEELDTDMDTDLVRVIIIGGDKVGKSSLCAQFVTSEHVNTYNVVGSIHSFSDINIQ